MKVLPYYTSPLSSLTTNQKLLLLIFIAISQSTLGAPIFSLHPKASALGNAVTAEAVGTASAAFNPATLSLVKTGKKGKLTEYKLLASKFPSYTFDASKPKPGEDPFLNYNLVINECSGSCLYQGNDPRDTPWSPEIDRLAVYIPKYGEIDIDDSLFEYILLPTLGSIYRPSNYSPITITTPIVLPMGGVHFKEADWSLRPSKISFGILGVNPTISYRINSKWSVGAGLELSIAGANFGLDYRLPSLIPSLVDVALEDLVCPPNFALFNSTCADDRAPLNPDKSLLHIFFEGDGQIKSRISLGMLWEPTPWFKWGLSYKQKSSHLLKGEIGVEFTEGVMDILLGLSDDIPAIGELISQNKPLPNTITGHGTVKLPQPTQWDTGISLQLTQKLRFNIDYKWKEHSAYNDSELIVQQANTPGSENLVALLFGIYKGSIHFGLPLSLSVKSARMINLKFKDSGHFAYGLSYRHSNRLTLRTGLEKKSIPVQGQRSVGALSNMSHYAVGFNYLWGSHTELDATLIRLELEESSRAGESYLTSAETFQPIAFWAGQHLYSQVNANILQLSWSKRI